MIGLLIQRNRFSDQILIGHDDDHLICLLLETIGNPEEQEPGQTSAHPGHI